MHASLVFKSFLSSFPNLKMNEVSKQMICCETVTEINFPCKILCTCLKSIKWFWFWKTSRIWFTKHPFIWEVSTKGSLPETISKASLRANHHLNEYSVSHVGIYKLTWWQCQRHFMRERNDTCVRKVFQLFFNWPIMEESITFGYDMHSILELGLLLVWWDGTTNSLQSKCHFENLLKELQ